MPDTIDDLFCLGRYGIDLYEVRDSKITLNDSDLKADCA
jgi:hypothetical protein